MSSLPSDPAKWPDDPYKLFDVTEAVTRQDLRRRYSQLIRQYKPDHAPEEFRRIRDAFETLQQHVQWREQFAAWNAQQLAAAADETPQKTDASPSQPPNARFEGDIIDAEVVEAEIVESAIIPPAAELSRKALDALIEDAWNVARTGDGPLGYRALAELYQQHPGDEEICVRLYWLLRMWPSVDSPRRAVDWLYEATYRRGLAGRLAELLRSHFDDDPPAALDPRCRELLRRDAPAWQLVGLAAKRWQAAAALGKAEEIAGDLRVLSVRLSDETTREWWARALLSAVDALAWIPGWASAAALNDCRRQLDELGELQLSLSQELDRRDLLQELTAGFDALHPAAMGLGLGVTWEDLSALERLLAAWWRLPFHEMRSQTERTLHPWVVTPQRGLLFFDQLRERCPAILSQLGDLIEAWHHHRVGGDEDSAKTQAENAAARDAVVGFFNQHSSRPLEQVRSRLLLFCIQEWIWPPQLMQLWATFPAPANEWLAWLESDAPFRCICRAYEAAWS